MVKVHDIIMCISTISIRFGNISVIISCDKQLLKAGRWADSCVSMSVKLPVPALCILL